jgi:hypothetical protein
MGFWDPIIIYAIVSLVVAYAVSSRAPETTIAPLTDIDVPTAVPVVFGTRVLKTTNVVWYGDLKYTAVKTKGGK